MNTYPTNSRRLNNEEMADLPEHGWVNFTEDPRAYKVSFMMAWETSPSVYQTCLEQGWLCLIHAGRFYVAR